LKDDLDSSVIESYVDLEVCEFQFGDKGRITAMGLLHYEGSDIYFVSNLVEETGNTSVSPSFTPIQGLIPSYG
jgi:hypothetical protein